jgi:hypothetical protein
MDIKRNGSPAVRQMTADSFLGRKPPFNGSNTNEGISSLPVGGTEGTVFGKPWISTTVKETVPGLLPGK